MAEVRNKRPYPVRIHDIEAGTTYRCAARPGTVEVPEALAKSLLEQEENWSDVKPGKSDEAKARKEGED